MSDKQRPNLLFIFDDSQPAGTLATYGNSRIRMPHLNQLARESVVFEKTYVTQPVCTPSRSSILCGLYPHTTGCTENNVPLDERYRCLPEMGDLSDYRTAYFGKWHLGDEIFPQHGFREWVAIEDCYRRYFGEDRDRFAHSAYHDFLLSHGYEPNVTEPDGYRWFNREFVSELPRELSKPAFIAGQCERFFGENKDDPFVLYINFIEPHFPYTGPNDGLHDPDEVPLPPNFHDPMENVPLRTQLIRRAFDYYREVGLPDWMGGLPIATEQDWRKLISNFWGDCSLIDTTVGSILTSLTRHGLDENTIVVFTSDHGDMVGGHGILAKGIMYEEAATVPLLIRLPGRKPERVTTPVSQIDLVPTLLELLGTTPPTDLHGQSRAAELRGEKAFAPRDVFVEWRGHHTGVIEDAPGEVPMMDCWRDMADPATVYDAFTSPTLTVVTPERVKYTRNRRGERELYFLADDPFELSNRASESSHESLIADLEARIEGFRERTDDPY